MSILQTQNNNPKYAWYVNQTLVDFIESVVEHDKIRTVAGCRIYGDYMLMCNSEGKIYGIRHLNTGIKELS